MTLEEAQEGLNREQRRFLAKLIKKGLEPIVARQKVLSDLRPPSGGNSPQAKIEANKAISGRTRFIRKSNG